MLCYFISKKNLSIIDCIEINSYSASHNLDCGGKTKIIIAGKPSAADEDFVVLKDGKDIKFKGIIENIDNEDGEIKHTVSCLEIEQVFNREIFLSNVDIIKTTGIEDFVAKQIETYFAASGDSFIDMPYIKCNVLTHTPASSKPSAENEIYNLKTYIGNIKQQYGIFLDFEFTNESLNISIYKKTQNAMQIDTGLTDVISFEETYKINALSKLSVLWLNTTTQEKSLRYFYLHSNRSVSEVNKDRIDGKIKSVYIEAETEAEMIEEAKKEFKSNSYSHSIEANIAANSKIYPKEELYVGHEITIKTIAGIKESIISKISHSDESDIISVKFGILKVKLTDKLKWKEH